MKVFPFQTRGIHSHKRHVPSQFRHAIRKIRWSKCIIYKLLINKAAIIGLKMLVASISPAPTSRLITIRPFPIRVVALRAVGIYPLALCSFLCGISQDSYTGIDSHRLH